MTPSTTRPASTHTRLWISKQSSRLVRWAVTEQLLPKSGVVVRIRDPRPGRSGDRRGRSPASWSGSGIRDRAGRGTAGAAVRRRGPDPGSATGPVGGPPGPQSGVVVRIRDPRPGRSGDRRGRNNRCGRPRGHRAAGPPTGGGIAVPEQPASAVALVMTPTHGVVALLDPVGLIDPISHPAPRTPALTRGDERPVPNGVDVRVCGQRRDATPSRPQPRTRRSHAPDADPGVSRHRACRRGGRGPSLGVRMIGDGRRPI